MSDSMQEIRAAIRPYVERFTLTTILAALADECSDTAATANKADELKRSAALALSADSIREAYRRILRGQIHYGVNGQFNI